MFLVPQTVSVSVQDKPDIFEATPASPNIFTAGLIDVSLISVARASV